MTPSQLTASLGDWSSGEGTLHVRLAESLRRTILAGGLQPGARLPAERILARSLAVSRSTVVAALDQLRQDSATPIDNCATDPADTDERISA